MWIDVVPCPFTGESIGRSDCQQRANAPRPFGGAAKLRWWEACQSCQHKGGSHG
ncbi:hypothetical protein [Methylogaea oryzae]|uniref:hypothetical protein n=1 Tax=Methylogaea oryzae TaxID=1295382 RepID=UPI0012E19FE1|nr:hypothetical protein [Methylogaea oryzae]